MFKPKVNKASVLVNVMEQCMVSLRTFSIMNHITHPYVFKAANRTQGLRGRPGIANAHFSFPTGVEWVCISQHVGPTLISPQDDTTTPVPLDLIALSRQCETKESINQ